MCYFSSRLCSLLSKTRCFYCSVLSPRSPSTLRLWMTASHFDSSHVQTPGSPHWICSENRSAVKAFLSTWLSLPNCCSTDNHPQGMGQVSTLIQPWPSCFIWYLAGLRDIQLIYCVSSCSCIELLTTVPFLVTAKDNKGYYHISQPIRCTVIFFVRNFRKK